MEVRLNSGDESSVAVEKSTREMLRKGEEQEMSEGVHEKDYSQYIYFHPSTRGQEGRCVFIDRDLLGRFVDLVDTTRKQGQMLAMELAALKSRAAGLDSASNISDGFSHRQTLGSVEVSYTVFQNASSKNRGPGVYITGFRRVNRGDAGGSHSAGLYRVAFSVKNGWSVSDSAVSSIDTAIGAIGAVFSEGGYRADSTAEAYGDFFSANVPGKKLNNCFSLYYAPSYLVDSLGVWQTPEQKTNPQGAGPKHLAQLFKATLPWSANPNPDIKYDWYVFGEGIKILSLALSEYRNIASGSLNEHQFTFLDPKASLGSVYQKLADVGATVSRSGYRMSSKAYAAKIHQAIGFNELASGMQRQDASWTKTENLVRPLAAVVNGFEGRGGDLTFADMVKELISNIDAGWA